MRFIPAARLNELPPGAATTVVVGDYEVALFNVGGRIFATESRCPHQGAPLAEGWVEDGCITCPWHAWTFRLETGKMVLGEQAGLAVFDVEIEGTTILVGAQPRNDGVF